MNVSVKIKEVPNKEDHYDMEISTYKENISGRFERSEIRHLIEQMDNSITVGCK